MTGNLKLMAVMRTLNCEVAGKIGRDLWFTVFSCFSIPDYCNGLLITDTLKDINYFLAIHHQPL